MDKKISNFPEYAHLTDERRIVHYNSRDPFVEEGGQVVEDSLESLIFAPDPSTGVPRSDLALILSKSSNPEVAQYIRENLMQQGNPLPSVESADDALAMVRGSSESFDTYKQRLYDLAHPSQIVEPDKQE